MTPSGSLRHASAGTEAENAAPYGAMGDSTLVLLVVGRDERAIEVLHRRYSHACASLALKLLRDDETAREVVQDAFLRVWLAGGSYDSGCGPFLPWLLGITYRRAVDALRVRRRQQSFSLEEWGAGGELEAPDTDALRALTDAETRESVRRCLMQLPANQRAPLELSYYGGLTQREIARALDTPLGTVKTRMVSGCRRLRKLLARSDGVA